MKLRSALAAFFMASMVAAAEASPVTFDFNLPAWTFTNDASLFGTHATLAITVDNGNASPASQTYTFGQVTQLGITTDGTYGPATWLSPISYLYPATPTTSSDIFFTTDGNGVATIDFDLNTNHYRFTYLNAPHGILELDFGADLLELIFVGPPASRSATIEGISALSGGPSTVPEPASLALLAGGLAAGLALRRRAKRA